MNQTESILDFEMQGNETVPEGAYVATFKDVQKTHHAEFGDGVMFLFEVAHGEWKGQTTARICKPMPSRTNATGKMIAGITGNNWQPGEKINLRPFLNQYYNVLVEPTQGGKTRIDRVYPYQRPSAPAGYQDSPPAQTFKPNDDFPTLS